jgi:hypothetical protein
LSKDPDLPSSQPLKLEAFEHLAKEKPIVAYKLPDWEADLMRELVKKHGSNVKRMEKDTKGNPWLWSKGQLEKRLKALK